MNPKTSRRIKQLLVINHKLNIIVLTREPRGPKLTANVIVVIGFNVGNETTIYLEEHKQPDIKRDESENSEVGHSQHQVAKQKERAQTLT